MGSTTENPERFFVYEDSCSSSEVKALVVAIVESARCGVSVGVGGAIVGVGVIWATGFAVILLYTMNENILKRKRNKKKVPQMRS